MKDLVLTGWSGAFFAEIAARTLPLLRNYAGKHGLELGCVNLVGERVPSWMKVRALYQQLERFDRVAWIDADVVVMDDSHNVFDFLGDGWQGIVEHHTDCGEVPNCGVWIVTPAMRPVLESMWNNGRIDHPWWEQAALLTEMGYFVTDAPHATRCEPNDLFEHTTFLDPAWNHHPADARQSPHPRFVHCTQYADRLGTVRQLVEQRRARA